MQQLPICSCGEPNIGDVQISPHNVLCPGTHLKFGIRHALPKPTHQKKLRCIHFVVLGFKCPYCAKIGGHAVSPLDTIALPESETHWLKKSAKRQLAIFVMTGTILTSSSFGLKTLSAQARIRTSMDKGLWREFTDPTTCVFPSFFARAK